MDTLDEAKAAANRAESIMNSDRFMGDRTGYAGVAAERAIALALIALVERLDELTTTVYFADTSAPALRVVSHE